MRMKKLKYLLVAAVLPLMMISCWDEPEQDINDPIVAGIWLCVFHNEFVSVKPVKFIRHSLKKGMT